MRGILEPEFIGLLQSFLYPKCMIQNPEVAPEQDMNAPRFAVTKSLQVVPLQREGDKKDPIFELFNPPPNSKQGRTFMLFDCQRISVLVLLTIIQINQMLNFVMQWQIW